MTIPGGGTEAPTPTDHHRRGRDRVVPDAPWVPAVVALLGALAFVVVRTLVAASGDIGRFVLAGDLFADPARAGVYVFGGAGYDGQFFYRLARDAFDVGPTAHGIAVDSALRFQRIGYPLLAWATSGGGRVFVPGALVAVNVAGLAALGWLGGVVARDDGRHALWGLLLPGYFGFAFTLSRDLSEIVEVALLVGGLLALRRGRPWTAALLLSGAVLSRETALFAVAGIAVTRLVLVVTRRRRLGTEDAVWVVPPLCFAAWQVVLYARIDTWPATSAHANEFVVPFSSLVSSLDDLLPELGWAEVVHVLELVVLLGTFALAVVSLRRTSAPLVERGAFAALVVGAVSVEIGGGVWATLHDFRMFADAYALAVLVLLGTRRNLAPVAIGVLVCTVGAAATLAHSL